MLKILTYSALLAACAMTCSCASMEPDGALKDLSDGEVFDGEPIAHVPPDNKALPPTPKPPLRWKMEL